MAKLTDLEFAVLQNGFSLAAHSARVPSNPYLWKSPLHDAYELGKYLQEKSISIGARDNWERKRRTYTNANGVAIRAYYQGCGFGFIRES